MFSQPLIGRREQGADGITMLIFEVGGDWRLVRFVGKKTGRQKNEDEIEEDRELVGFGLRGRDDCLES